MAKLTISILEEKLLAQFPAYTACSWDKTGLLLGDGSAEIKNVAVALDPTITAINAAAEADCNLLLTHHPAILPGMLPNIENFSPANSVACGVGSLVYTAVEQNIALMNFHTALDVCDAGASQIPNLLNLKVEKVACPTPINKEHCNVVTHEGKKIAAKNSTEKNTNKVKLGFGRICKVAGADRGAGRGKITLEKLRDRCIDAFKRVPRVWGTPETIVSKIVTTTGSTGSFTDPESLLKSCINQNVDVIICGEIKYHDALVLQDEGISVIELGHDVSELPLTTVLAKYANKAGVAKKRIVMLDQNHNWF